MTEGWRGGPGWLTWGGRVRAAPWSPEPVEESIRCGAVGWDEASVTRCAVAGGAGEEVRAPPVAPGVRPDSSRPPADPDDALLLALS
jgi:hypothetical protein